MTPPIPFDNSYARLSEGFFVRTDPSPVSSPGWIAFNRDLSDELGLDSEALDSDEGLAYFSGNSLPPGAEPLAMAYAGHQFGGFVPQLGDGRALLLGEVVDRAGERYDIQLKGAGPTPFSRRGDGRSALGPVLREYLVSESMAALGVPTTRALAAVATGDTVWREQGEPGGVFTRVARSHLRIGTFEYFAARGKVGHLRELVAFAIERHDPRAAEAENPATALFEGVVRRQARLVARWMGLGFIHGVMNTDNTSLSGETIDYGPCAFLDRYDPAKKFSFIDQFGRYAYGNQPGILQWNLARFAEALLPVIAESEGGSQEGAAEVASAILERFPDWFEAERDAVFAAKLGFEQGDARTRELVADLLDAMQDQAVDFHLAFRRLTSAVSAESEGMFLSLFAEPARVESWLEEWRGEQSRRGMPEGEAGERMRGANPARIPRNHRIEEAIRAAYEGEFSSFHRLHEALRNPFEDRDEFSEYEKPPRQEEEVKATFCGT